MNAKILAILVLLPFAVGAQGFSGLGTDADGFATPEPDAAFSFPADHGPHPDYRIEWWYLTANLEDADGTPYGLQWTLFRSALAPGEAEGWRSPQVWFAHAAVTTPEQHFVTERFARGGIGQAGVRADPFRAWIDEWALEGPDFDALSLRATSTDFGYDMALRAQGPLVFHGKDGYSVKSAQGQASYYYSQPFYKISGTLDLPQGPVEVSGTAWLDREWSSQPLSDDQTGWDWFSLSFESGAKMMGFQLRQTDGTGYSSSTWIDADGTSTAYDDGVFSAVPLSSSSVAGRDVPTQWRVRHAAQGVDVTVEALNTGAWMDLSIPYWEGPVTVTGTHKGRGYLEMTGYE
ncbi:Secreted hydrolase [Sulfitobacter noctilucicola]|uniref:Putative secreted hydrolase n=1 Tax=Sulfitobacter noctilucicola TaxID=1342301 RepID=A0A7W6MBR4_9RHOB|nr:lipocalin-like domain-containing protein [Sulfitobacter noctilucicola]KIN63949.1 Secreted hydrolase [Sulfitobacter noctilucicola]MBB4175307.1 putative secreted hydrolase [Sulfitobacter noctilucicola]